MSAQAPRPRPSESTDLFLYITAAALALVGGLWVAGAVSARLSGHRIPHGHPLAGLVALAHTGDPSWAWQAPVGPAVLYWTVTGAALSLVTAAVLVAWHVVLGKRRKSVDDPTAIDGLADRRQVKSAAGPVALLTRAATLRLL